MQVLGRKTCFFFYLSNILEVGIRVTEEDECKEEKKNGK